MVISAHQPNYLPYLGFFDKMNRSDIFIIHDDVQFNRRDFQNRNKIRIHDGWKWLTVPVLKCEIDAHINEILINNNQIKNKPMWSDMHLRDIHANYKNSPFFKSYKDDLDRIYKQNYTYLSDLNFSIIEFLTECFDISVEFVRASNLEFNTTSTQKLVDMVKELGGTTYLSGEGGNNYLDTSLFGDIQVELQNFNHPIYAQRYDGFIPNMSAIDALFNVGKLPEVK